VLEATRRALAFSHATRNCALWQREAGTDLDEEGGGQGRNIAGEGTLAVKSNGERLYSVHRSPIHGRGVFATRKIRKGATILEYKGKHSTYEEALERAYSDPDDPSHTFLFELENGTVIDAGIDGNAARWVNHSCSPNCETYEDDAGHVFIKARRQILPGEELTYDYCLTVPGKLSKRERAFYACHCPSSKCRGSLLVAKRPRSR